VTPEQFKRTPLVAVQVERARRSLAYFVRSSWHVLEPDTPLQWSWHMDALCLHIQAMLKGWAKRRRNPLKFTPAQNLLVNIPPGTAKSRILSVCTPAWAWLHWPGWRVKCLSGNPEVALRDSVYCRDLILSDWYQSRFRPEWRLTGDQNTKGSFRNTRGGERMAKGMEASSIGTRADALFIDDPNDAKKVYDEKHRRSVNDRWDQAIWNRVNSPIYSIRIGIMQRLHEDDWSGHLLGTGTKKSESDAVKSLKWAHLCLPMEFDPERACETPSFKFRDPRTYEGELLHPERFPQEVLDAERGVLGSLGYAAQMNQRPASAEGNLFKRSWWRFFGTEGQRGTRPRRCYTGPAVATPTRLDWLLLSVDANFKKTEDGSRVSILAIGGLGANRYVFDNRTRPMSFTESVKEIRAMVDKWPEARKKLIENKANGEAIIDTLTNEIDGLIAINPEGGKESRAAAISPTVESHNVYLLDDAAWLEPFVSEFGAFPAGAHDDQVDSLSQALIYMQAGSDLAFARAICTA
jgi:predicted phage terminase large subunit-like protein